METINCTDMNRAVRVILELETGTDSICGLLYADELPARRFDGYVQLIGVLEQVHIDAGCVAAEPDPPDGRGDSDDVS